MSTIQRILPALIVCMVMLCGCASVVYSPALSLPAGQVMKHQTQVSVHWSGLVESLPGPSEVTTKSGAALGLRYGFTDRLFLQAKYWSAFDNRGGASVAGMFLVSSDSNDWSGLHIESGLANNKNSIEGWGTAVRYTRSGMVSRDIGFYAAIGPMFGYHSIGDVGDGEWGSGVITNFGSTWNINPYCALNAEIAFLLQYNHSGRYSDFIAAPTVGLVVSL